MILTILSYRFPGLPGAVHAAMQALLLAVVLVATLALSVAVLVAVAPVLPQLMAGVGVTGLYAVATCPKAKVQPCK